MIYKEITEVFLVPSHTKPPPRCVGRRQMMLDKTWYDLQPLIIGSINTLHSLLSPPVLLSLIKKEENDSSEGRSSFQLLVLSSD